MKTLSQFLETSRLMFGNPEEHEENGDAQNKRLIIHYGSVKLTEPEKDTVRSYSNKTSKPIAVYMVNRANRPNMAQNRDLEPYIRNLNSIIGKSPGLPENLHAYSNQSGVVNDQIRALRPGQTWNSPAFISTSTKMHHSSREMLHFDLPVGHQGSFHLAGMSNYRSENEHLLAPGRFVYMGSSTIEHGGEQITLHHLKPA